MSKDNKKNIVTLNSLKSFTKSSSMDSIKAAVLAAILGLVFGFIVMLPLFIAIPNKLMQPFLYRPIYRRATAYHGLFFHW